MHVCLLFITLCIFIFKKRKEGKVVKEKHENLHKMHDHNKMGKKQYSFMSKQLAEKKKSKKWRSMWRAYAAQNVARQN